MSEPQQTPPSAGPLARKLASRILYEALFAAFDQDTLGHGTHFSGPGSAARSMEQLLEGAALGLESLSRRFEGGLAVRPAIEAEMLLLFPIFAANHVDAVIELCARHSGAESGESPRQYGIPAASRPTFGYSRQPPGPAQPLSPGDRQPPWAPATSPHRQLLHSSASFELSSLPSLRSAASLGSDLSPHNIMLQPVSPPRRPSRKPQAAAKPAAEDLSPRQPHRESRYRSISPRWRVGGGGFADIGAIEPPQLSPHPPAAPADPAVARYMDADGRVLVADGKGRIAWRMVGGAPGSLGSRRVPLRVHALVVEKGRDAATALFASSFRLFLVPALVPGAGTPPPRNFYESVAEIWPGVSCVSLRASDTFDSIVCPLPDAELTLILISDLDRVSIPLVLDQAAPATPRRWTLPRTAAAFSFGSYTRVCVALSVPGPVEIDTASALPTTSIDVFSLARLLNA